MKKRILAAGIIFALAMSAAESGAELFQKAVTAERAAGNLEEAIKLYQRVATEFASDRALAAKALVAEARCYEKLGKDNAVKIYEQVARDYKDQREPSTTANARLAALRLGNRPAGPATMTQRKIELPVPDDRFAQADTDGRREAYLDANTGALAISDLAGKSKRVIFNPKAGERIVGFDISRDSSGVLLRLEGPDGRHFVFVRIDGTGYRESGAVSGDKMGWDLSWDNRYVFNCMPDPDGSRQLWRWSMTDGEIRKVPMACGEWNRPSPDGRFIAISDWPNFGRVAVAPIQGGEPQLVSDDARLIDWTRDGRYLILASARSGSEALYLFPVKDGRRSGDSILIRYGPCPFGWVNAEGAVLCESTEPGGYSAGWLGTLDSSGRSVEWREWNPSAGSTRWFFTAWSPDSSQIATVQGAQNGKWSVRLDNIASREEREVYQGSSEPPFCAWPENAKLICTKISAQPPIDVFSISLDSGRVESLGTVPGFYGWPLFGSADGRAVYIARQPGEELIRWDVATRQAASVDRSTGLFTSGGGPISIPHPTERWIARRNKETIEIRPTAGGEWKPLISLPVTSMAFTPDGNSLLFHDVDAAGKHGLFRVSTAGGPRERIGDFPNVPRENSELRVSPDGRKFLVKSRTGQQVWILENFEPKQTATR
jgi:Tetratricopeptide repeat